MRRAEKTRKLNIASSIYKGNKAVEEHLEIIKNLSNGINPLTGEVFEDEHICHNAKITTALMISVKSLENEIEKIERKNNLPKNAGSSWSSEEDADLIVKFDNGSSIKELSKILERTEGSIRSRLARHGKLNI